MHTEGNVEIDKPIDAVFRLTTEQVAAWSEIVVEDECLVKKPEGVGSTFRSVTEDRGKRMEFMGTVVKHDPPTGHAVRMTGDAFDLAVEYRFEEIGEGRTRVTQISDVAGKGFVKVMFLLLGWMMKKSSCDALDQELNRLKEYCEQQA